MKKLFAGTAAVAATLSFASGALAFGAPYCGTYAEPTITAPVAGLGTECQSAVTKGTQKYVKSLLKVRGKCLAGGDSTACPNVDDDAKVQKAASKIAASIAAACSDTAGLSNSYQGVDGSNVASCTLSQNHATGELFLAALYGNGALADLGHNATVNGARNECQATLANASQKFLISVLKSVDKCIEGRIKGGLLNDLANTCVGSLAPAGYTDVPSDEKTAEAIAKATTKLQEAISEACTGVPSEQIGFMFGCPGATSLADLQSCAQCSGLNALFEIVNQQYNETGTVVTATPVPSNIDDIQVAVDAAAAGTKFLIASGDYDEGVFLPAATCTDTLGSCLSDDDCPAGTCVSGGDDMTFVGCGAATDDRPRIIPPAVSPPTRGFSAAGVDGLTFQGLEVTGWSADGIFVTNADGVTFRDCLGNGDDLSTPEIDSTSTYAFFPIASTNVVVETSEVINVRDAGIYVGQSIGIDVRYNYVHDNVTGIEVENSENANVYGNVASANAGGLLSFKLPGLPKQTSGGHYFFENTASANNTPNFGDPNSTVGNVPFGTGFMIISEDDSVFENNLVTKNRTYGLLIIDQEAANILTETKTCGESATNAGADCDDDTDCTGDVCVTNHLFDPTSPDQAISNLQFLNNRIPSPTSASANGSAQNPETSLRPPPGSLFPGAWTLAINTGNNGTCWTPVPTQSAQVAPLGSASFAACP